MTGEAPLVPPRVAALASRDPAGRVWLEQLPARVQELARNWRLRLGQPFGHDGWTAVVVPAVREDGTPVVLKLGFPHMEANDEGPGLRFWSGDPTVHLLDHDPGSGALLLERCLPGHDLRVLAAEERDVVLARLVPRLWREPPQDGPFRHLSEMIAYWSQETLAVEETWPDEALVREGLAAWAELVSPGPDDVLLGTDVHAGNVLAAEREPWLIIDPKPFVGDMAYDATQHLFDAEDRLKEDPLGFVRRYAGLLGVQVERVQAWAFARYAAEKCDTAEAWAKEHDLARRLAP